MKAKILAVALLCFVTTVSARAADSVSGSVKAVEGSCSVQRGTLTVAATEGMHLMEQDALITGSNGRLAVIMRDGTRISLGPDSRLSIVQFLYNPSDNKFALLLDLSRGILAYISGKIAKFSPEAVRIQTPVGSIGVRGTRFAVGLGVAGGAQ